MRTCIFINEMMLSCYLSMLVIRCNVCHLCRASLERERKKNGKDVTDEN